MSTDQAGPRRPNRSAKVAAIQQMARQHRDGMAQARATADDQGSAVLGPVEAEAIVRSLTQERTLSELIAGRGWLSLGYPSFSDLYRARLTGMYLRTDEARAAAVYALLDEGLSDEEIIETLDGRLGDEAVALIRRWYDAGVPAQLVSTRQRRPKPQELS